MKRASLILLMFAMFSSAVVDARVAVGTLAGTVLDAKGLPVAGASVTIQTSDGLHPNATYADKDGHFQFARYKTGQYDLRATSGKTMSPWMKRIMIHANKTTDVTLRLTATKH